MQFYCLIRYIACALTRYEDIRMKLYISKHIWYWNLQPNIHRFITTQTTHVATRPKHHVPRLILGYGALIDG